MSIEVTSDQRANFGGRIVNYEDPNLSVQLPIFIIHGNHDDPTREGTTEALSALDILAEAGLINYFGRADQVDDIHIKPVLIEKGPVKVALYGLGYVRDERLHRAFRDKKVKFTKADGPGEDGDWYNVMLIHQNRAQKGRGEKNCVAESMIPDFMDFVIWGHEHECEIRPVEKGKFYLSQPGSSIAVSLVESEALPKHVGILEIRRDRNGFASRLIPVPLKTVRPFLLDTSVELSEEPTLKDIPEANKQDAVMEFLTNRVNQMLEDYRAKLRHEGKLVDDLDLSPAEREALRKRQTPLIRLKVEHSKFPTINLRRFGAQFATTVANYDDILQFWKKKVITAPGSRIAIGITDLDALDEDEFGEHERDPEAASSQRRIQRLTEKILQDAKQNLELFTDNALPEALERFVTKEENSAIDELVAATLESVQGKLKSERRLVWDDEAIGAAVTQLRDKVTRKEELEKMKAAPRKERADLARIVPSRGANASTAAVADDEEVSEEEPAMPVTKSRAGTAKASTTAKSKSTSVDDLQTDEDDGDFDVQDDDETSTSPARAKSTTVAKGSKQAAVVTKKTTSGATAASSRASKKMKQRDESDDEESHSVLSKLKRRG